MQNQKPKYKILCLHGDYQNAQKFREKSGGFRRLLKFNFEFDFLDGPFFHANKSSDSSKDDEKIVEEQRTWYFYEPDYSKYYKWKESLKYVLDYITKEGPFDGILAFSQGNLILHFLLFFTHPQITSSTPITDQSNPLYVMQQLYKELVTDPIPLFKFCILISNFVPSDVDLNTHFKKCVEDSIQLEHVPCIAVIGNKDEIIRKEISVEYLKLIKDPLILFHDGGHFAPRNKDIAEPINKFLQQILQ